ncbi:MAG TPA: transcription termination factor NusA [Acidobacteriota bacterium]|nr:transcription termination factor NusA [Acidobacteriota bacterium]
MANILGQQIDMISKEKGIDADIIRGAIEDAMVAAAKKFFKTTENLQARLDLETGMIEVFAVKEIVEEVEDPDEQMSLEEAVDIDPSFEVGDYIEIPKPTLELGRISAQTAKQVINQKIREAEREQIYEEFKDRIGDMENGVVRRREGRDVILEIGRKRIEALLPYSEQSRIEQYNPGDRVSISIIKVHRVSKGPQIVVSRTDPSLLIRLFEREIPEVYDGTVVIKNAVREGGERAKVAVASKDDTVDPVGACVGMKGSRINAVIRELRGEKIDIIQYSDDIVEYAINALNPARISKVLISDLEENVLEVIVPEDQLSLAIGKKGQNVRLASRLLGWEIDIKSAEEKKREILSQMEEQFPEEEVSLSITEEQQEMLEEAGFETVEDLVESGPGTLAEKTGMEDDTAQDLISRARAFLHARSEDELEDEEFEDEDETAEDTAAEEGELSAEDVLGGVGEESDQKEEEEDQDSEEAEEEDETQAEAADLENLTAEELLGSVGEDSDGDSEEAEEAEEEGDDESSPEESPQEKSEDEVSEETQESGSEEKE